MVWTSDLLNTTDASCMDRHLRNNSSLFHLDLVAFKTFLMMFHILCTILYNIKFKAKQTLRSQLK